MSLERTYIGRDARTVPPILQRGNRSFSDFIKVTKGVTDRMKNYS